MKPGKKLVATAELDQTSPTTIKALPPTDSSVSTTALADALVQAINLTKPRAKKTVVNYDPQTPWSPPSGEVKHRLKRKAYQHGILLDDAKLTNEQIDLFNKLRPGVFGNGFFRVTRRRDKGIDLDYPFRTPAQRMRVSSEFGLRDVNEVLQFCIDESLRPKRLEIEDLED